LFRARQATIRPNVPINFDRFAQLAVIPISLYLASDEATYYEGAVLVVDGGRTGARQRARGSAALSRIAAFERWRPGRP
jgi:NAD(P)-dependent dehydrogenase (short-subunit alcohol dehydrogenase family)